MNNVTGNGNNQYLFPTQEHLKKYYKLDFTITELYHLIENNARHLANALKVPTINKSDEEIASELVKTINSIFESKISKN